MILITIVDIVGVIVYIMLCGFPPFRSPNRKQTELFDMIETGQYEFLQPYWDDVTDLAKDLIKEILVVDPKQRYTASQILNHHWLTQYGLTRNNTMELEPSKLNKFRATVRGIQSIKRMQNLVDMKLERGENFITRVSHPTHSEASAQ